MFNDVINRKGPQWLTPQFGFSFWWLCLAAYTRDQSILHGLYYLFIDVWRYYYPSFLHLLQALQTLLVIPHLVVVFDYYGKKIPSSHWLLDIGLHNQIITSDKSLMQPLTISLGLLSARSFSSMNFWIKFFLVVMFSILPYLSLDVDLLRYLIASVKAAEAF